MKKVETLPTFKTNFKDYIPYLKNHIHEYKQAVTEIAEQNEPATVETFIKLTELDDASGIFLGPLGHLMGVMDSDEVRSVQEEMIPLSSEFSSWLGFHKQFANKIIELADSGTLDTVHQRIFDKSKLSFELSGLNLPEQDQEDFAKINQRLAELSNKFSKNALDAMKAFSYHVTDERELAGVPDTALALYKQAAIDKNLDGFLVTLDAPSITPLLTYCDNKSLREKVYKANATKASAESEYPEFDNTDIINEIMSLRHKMAVMLDKGTPADISLLQKMAGSAKEVQDFMYDTAYKAKAKAEHDEVGLRDFAANKGCTSLELWDRGYYANKMKKELYDVDNQLVKEYFQLENVLSGLFKLVNTLYDIEVHEEQLEDVWHPDVKFFRLYKDKEHFASVYMDLYADPARKRAGAWMDEPVIRWKHNDTLQLPVAYNVCNFQRPTTDTPSLLSFGDVETMFHEFGHALHHMLTEVDIYDVSGINGVEWDAVELPSQIMENWCWSPEVINDISSHYKTGEKLPDELYQKMLNAKNFLSGHGLLRQMELGLFDMEIHMEPEGGRTIREVLRDVRDKIAVTETPEYNRFENTFSHIFAGGYAAGYYSYIWAQILADDCFLKFEEEGIFNKDTANRFRETILSEGGLKSMNELFTDFMGRDPDPAAMLKNRGIT